jgi:hypothetical protein
MALFGSEKLFQIGDEEEILKTLAGRKDWDQVRPEVLRALIRNSKNDVLSISRFVFVSEYHDCVRNNYVELSKIWEDPRLALSAFAATLVGLAGDIIQHLGDMAQGSERQGQAIGMVEISFLSAVLCDPYMLVAYKGLATFYQGTGKGRQAAVICRRYDEAEQALLRGEDEYTRAYRETKYKPTAASLRAAMDRLKAQVG